MNNIFQKEIFFTYSDFDIYDNIFISSILKCFQDIAGEHADILGCGYEEMKSKGIIWIVVRAKLDIYSQPKEKQLLILETKVKKIRGISIEREFSIRDKFSNELIVSGQYVWCLASIEKRNLIKPTSLVQPDVFDENYIYSDSLKALPNFNHEDKSKKEFAVNYTDLDHNLHMNNCKYADLIQNTIETKLDNFISSYEIDYEKEICKNETINLFYQMNEDESFILKAINSNNEVNFKARIKFRQKF